MCQQRCRLTPENVALGKRSFAEYGRQTLLEVTAENYVLKPVICFRNKDEDEADDERATAEVKHAMDTPISELVAAGGDLEQIKSKICELNGELPPPFPRKQHLCLQARRHSFLP